MLKKYKIKVKIDMFLSHLIIYDKYIKYKLC